MPVLENDYLFNSIEIGLALIDQHGKFIRVNPYFCELTGYSQEELEHRTFQSVTHPDDVNEDLSEIEKLVSKRTNRYVLLKRFINRYGDAFWVRVIVEPIIVNEKIENYLKQIIPLKNGVREQIRKAENKIEIVEQINIGNFISKNIWKVVQIVVICLATILGYLFTVGTKMFADANRLDRIEKILEEKVEQ